MRSWGTLALQKAQFSCWCGSVQAGGEPTATCSHSSGLQRGCCGPRTLSNDIEEETEGMVEGGKEVG